MTQPHELSYSNAMPKSDHEGAFDSNADYIGYQAEGEGGPDYIQRPLSELTGIPYRGSGVTAHGVDVDTLRADYIAPGATELPWDGKHPVEDVPDVLPVHQTPPVDVRLIDDVSGRRTQRVTNIRQVFGNNEVFYSVPGAPDTLRMGDNQAFGADDERDSVVFSCEASPSQISAQSFGSGAYLYGFAISSDSSFSTYALVYQSGRTITVKGTNAIYVAIVPFTAYDPTKTNFNVLNAVAEYTRAL